MLASVLIALLLTELGLATALMVPLHAPKLPVIYTKKRPELGTDKRPIKNQYAALGKDSPLRHNPDLHERKNALQSKEQKYKHNAFQITSNQQTELNRMYGRRAGMDASYLKSQFKDEEEKVHAMEHYDFRKRLQNGVRADANTAAQKKAKQKVDPQGLKEKAGNKMEGARRAFARMKTFPTRIKNGKKFGQDRSLQRSQSAPALGSDPMY